MPLRAQCIVWRAHYFVDNVHTNNVLGALETCGCEYTGSDGPREWLQGMPSHMVSQIGRDP